MVRVVRCVGSAADPMVVRPSCQAAEIANASRGLPLADRISNRVPHYGTRGLRPFPGGVFQDSTNAWPSPALCLSLHNVRWPVRSASSENTRVALVGFTYSNMPGDVVCTAAAISGNRAP